MNIPLISNLYSSAIVSILDALVLYIDVPLLSKIAIQKSASYLLPKVISRLEGHKNLRLHARLLRSLRFF